MSDQVGASDFPTGSLDRQMVELVIERFDKIDAEISDLREEMIKRTAPFTPLPGEVVFLGTRWRREHILPVTIALALMGILSRGLWKDIDNHGEALRIQGEAISALQAFAAAGGRATASEVADGFACVEMRFNERFAGIVAGEHLAPPDASRIEEIAECQRRLRELVAELRKR